MYSSLIPTTFTIFSNRCNRVSFMIHCFKFKFLFFFAIHFCLSLLVNLIRTMRSIRTRTLLITSIFFILSSYCNASEKEQTNLHWEQVYNKDDIIILDRWIPETSSSISFRERKGVLLVKCSADVAFKLISDPKFTSQWMNGVKECKDFHRKGNTWENYTLFGLPWPFDNRELYSRLTTSVSPEGYLKILIQSIDTIVSIKNKPLKDYYAEWTFKTLSNGYLEITMVSSTKTLPIVPLFIQDPILLMVYKENFMRLKSLLSNTKTLYLNRF